MLNNSVLGMLGDYNRVFYSLVSDLIIKLSNREWIKEDISTSEGIEAIADVIADRCIDILIFSAGVWEEKGFMSDFSFQATKDEEICNIMSINRASGI